MREYLQGRYERVLRATTFLQRLFYQTHVFFSPIVHSHPMSLHMPPAYNTFEFWVEGVDDHLLPVMDECWVYMESGWTLSKGVTHEMDKFKEQDKVIKYIDPVSYNIQDSPDDGGTDD